MNYCYDSIFLTKKYPLQFKNNSEPFNKKFNYKDYILISIIFILTYTQLYFLMYCGCGIHSYKKNNQICHKFLSKKNYL